MALRKSKLSNARFPAPTAIQASALFPVVAEYVVETGLALNDVVEMAPYPAGTMLIDMTLAVEDSDSNGTPLIGLDVGLMTLTWLDPTTTRTCGAELLSASTIARTGGMAQLALPGQLLAAPSTADRSIGIKVQAAAATLTVGAKWRLFLTFAPLPPGILAV
jgi:hypothetical protein